MSLDRQIYGPSNWHLPSPSSTPKSVTFPDSSFKTPTTETCSRSHFVDPRSTPHFNERHIQAQTPSLPLLTPVDRSFSLNNQSACTPQDPQFHVNHFAPQNLFLPPVDVSRRLSSSLNPNQPRTVGTHCSNSRLASPNFLNMDFSHMQTPPPTRDATSRRSLPQSAGNNFSTPATVIQRTPNQVPRGEAMFNQTPFGFPSTHFSPDMMPFANVGPMSAPPMPQSRLFWDTPSHDVTHMDVDFSLATDSFGVTPHKMESDMNWQVFNPPDSTHMDAMAFQSFQDMPAADPTASFVSTSIGVDPTMLFSFSGPDMTSSFGSMPQQTTRKVSSRQPYETQARDSRREKETVKNVRGRHSRSNTDSSSGSVENTRPGMHRRSTDGGLRKSRPVSVDSRGPSTQAAASIIQRRPSPLKRQGMGPLTVIPEIRRPRTRLIIDETGRARTETVPPSDEGDAARSLRRTSEQDMRRHYPGLWEEGDTESDDDDPPPIFSRNTSFNVPQPPRRSSSKHARAESGSMDRIGAFKVARPASRPSHSTYDNESFETIRPIRKSADKSSRRFSMMDLPDSFERYEESGNAGDALGALKKVVAGRQQRIERASHNTLQAHNRRWAQASADQIRNSASPHGPGQYDLFSNSFYASPNTDGLTTPSTDRSSVSSESTRCVCNGADDSQPMVQCESCNKWLHMTCIGLNRKKLPPVYVCIFCTGQTPVARGGRVRGPVPFDSPLTQKTGFRR